MAIDVLLGLQWGDEGKGKIVDLLAPTYDIIARFQGGPNAGHTLVIDGTKFVLHSVPSGIIHEGKTNIIGNGMVIDPVVLRKEILKLEEAGIEVKSRLIVSKKANLILPSHKLIDAVCEQHKGKDKIGSTLKGIGPTYRDKASRDGLRIGDIFLRDFEEKYNELTKTHAEYFKTAGFELDRNEEKEWFEAIEVLKELNIQHTEYLINDAAKEGKKILAEGAQGTLLDIDFGTYPFVTSSNTITASACTGLGVPPQSIKKVMGVMKAYTTRVGSGPFPTELHDKTGEEIRKEGNEFGSTTGRPRRCGWLDIVAMKYACMLNGVTELILTKSDVLSTLDTINAGMSYKSGNNFADEYFKLINDKNLQASEVDFKSFEGWKSDIAGINDYKALPLALTNYIDFIEKELGVPFSIISTGPDRKDTIINK